MDTIKLGLIGAGFIAKAHLKALEGLNDMRVVGITSRTVSKAKSLADEFRIPHCTETVESLVESAKPDALLVLVSPDQIYDVSSAAMQFGLPLFIEKPAGMVPQETWSLASLARKHSVRTMVGYNRRYYSIFHKGLEIIQERGPLLGVTVEGHERIWRIRESNLISNKVICHWIFANMTHTVDLLRFFGGEPANVMSLARRYKEPCGDQFAAVLDFNSGALGVYLSHWYSPGSWSVVLYGEGATVEFRPLEKGRWIDADFKSHEIEPDNYDIEYKTGFYRQMQAFGKLIREGIADWPAQDLDGAYQTMILAQRIALNLSELPHIAART